MMPSEVGTTNTSWKPALSRNVSPQKALHLLARCRCLWTRHSGKEATCTGYNCACVQLTWPLDTWWRVTSCTLNHNVIANTTKQVMNISGVNTHCYICITFLRHCTPPFVVLKTSGSMSDVEKVVRQSGTHGKEGRRWRRRIVYFLNFVVVLNLRWWLVVLRKCTRNTSCVIIILECSVL